MGARSGEEREPGGARPARGAGKAGLVTRDEGWGEDGEPGIPRRTARPGQLPDAAGTGLRCRAPTWGRAAVGQRADCIPRGAEEMAGIPPAAPRSGFGAGGAGRAPAGPGTRAGAAGRCRGLPGLSAMCAGGGPPSWQRTPNHCQHLGSPADSSVLPGLLAPPNLGSGSGPLGPPRAEPSSVPADQAFSLGDCAQHPTRRTQRLRVVRPLLVPAYAFGKPWPLRSSVVLGLAFVAGEQALLVESNAAR